jgi:hypothetical protein
MAMHEKDNYSGFRPSCQCLRVWQTKNRLCVRNPTERGNLTLILRPEDFSKVAASGRRTTLLAKTIYVIRLEIRSEFASTLTLDMAMANDAKTGFTMPNAASGMSTML